MTTVHNKMMSRVIECEKRNMKNFVKRVLPTIIICVLGLLVFKIL